MKGTFRHYPFMSEEQTRTRRTALKTVGSLVIAGLAGCNSAGSSEPDDQPTETATDAPTETATAESAATSTEESTDTATAEQSDGHDHTHTEAPDDAQFVENPEEIHPTLVEETSVPDDEVLLGFRLEDSSLPFTTEVYQAPEDATIHATKTFDTQDLSEVDLVPDNPEALDTVETDREDIHYGTTKIGEPLVVTLVARNDEETLDWSSWSRTGYPYDGDDEENPALKVDCYCGGMNYTAPSGGTWARVIQVTPTERVDSGTTIALNWTSSRL